MNTQTAQLRTLVARQQRLNQKQHKRLARKIHDDISQKMTLLALQLSLAASDETPPKNWNSQCQGWADLVMILGQGVRDLVGDLQTKITDQTGLAAALHWLSQSLSKGAPCEFVPPRAAIALDVVVANELFDLVRDLLVDVLVPGGAGKLALKLDLQSGAVAVQLAASPKPGVTQAISQVQLEQLEAAARLESVGGQFELENDAEGNSILWLTVPQESAVPATLPATVVSH